jgi:adenine deaminase
MRKLLIGLFIFIVALAFPTGARELTVKGFSSVIDTACDIAPASLLLTNAKVVNVFTGEIIKGNVAVRNGIIAGIGNYQRGEKVIDLQGKYLIPGLINYKVQVENYLINIPEFARTVIPHGTTAIVADPHELVNVLGDEGIKYLLRYSDYVPLEIYIMAPACVPDSNLETSGAALDANEVTHLLKNDRILGLTHLGEARAVLDKNNDLLIKIIAAHKAKKLIDGYAPALLGADLQAYLSAGISLDYAGDSGPGVLEKLNAGLALLLKEGSGAFNYDTLLKPLNSRNYDYLILGTASRGPQDLLNKGDLDYALKQAVALGIEPVQAIRMATLNPAKWLGLKFLGAIAPGYQADLVAVEDLKDFKIYSVIKDGVLVFIGGKYLYTPMPESESLEALTAKVRHTVYLPELTPEAFKIKARGTEIKVIKLEPGQITTQGITAKALLKDGELVPDLENDILKLAVVERHHNSGNLGLAMVQGFGLREGALATSVAHNSHNIVVVGTNDADMYAAVKQIAQMEGGFAAAANGKVLGTLPLPLAGLMSEISIDEVVQRLDNLIKITQEMGCRQPDPFYTMSYLALTTLPELRLTDLGLVEVKKSKIVPLWEK